MQAGVRNAPGPAREVSAIVPARRPDPADAHPGLLPWHRSQTGALPRIEQHFLQSRWGRQRQQQCPQAGQHFRVVLRGSFNESLCFLSNLLVFAVGERFIVRAEGHGDGGRQPNPIGQPAAQAVEVVGLAAHYVRRELVLRYHPGSRQRDRRLPCLLVPLSPCRLVFVYSGVLDLLIRHVAGRGYLHADVFVLECLRAVHRHPAPGKRRTGHGHCGPARQRGRQGPACRW